MLRFSVSCQLMIVCFSNLFGQTSPSIQEIDTLALETLSEWNIPGLSLAIVQDNKPLHIAGYGVRKEGSADPVNGETIFQIASLSKAFTAACVAIAVEDGKLEWERPIRDYLPSFRLKDQAATMGMTLRDLLSHRTGLPGTARQCWRLWYNTNRTTDDLIQRLSEVDPIHPFRSHFTYNNMTYVVASKVVEQATGIPWQKFCQTRIFDPLAMTRTGLSYALLTNDNNVASAHFNKMPIPWYNWENTAAAAGINSSAKDMAAWLIYCLHPSKALGEAQRPQSVMESEGLFNPIVNLSWPLFAHEQNVVSYGYGFGIYNLNGTTVLFHIGMSDGMQSVLAILPEKQLGIAILTNQTPGLGHICLLNELIDRFLGCQDVAWHAKGHAVVQSMKKQLSLQHPEELAKSVLPLNNYAGTYHHPAYGTVTISCSQDQLELILWNGEKGPLKSLGEHRFLLNLPSAPPLPWIAEFELQPDSHRIQAVQIPDLGRFEKAS